MLGLESDFGVWEMESKSTTSALGEGTRSSRVQGNSSEGRDTEQGTRPHPLRSWRDNETLTHGLEVERHHLTADVPEHLGHVIGGVHPGAFGVNPAHLSLVVSAVALLETSLEQNLCTLGLAHGFRVWQLLKLFYLSAQSLPDKK